MRAPAPRPIRTADALATALRGGGTVTFDPDVGSFRLGHVAGGTAGVTIYGKAWVRFARQARDAGRLGGLHHEGTPSGRCATYIVAPEVPETHDGPG